MAFTTGEQKYSSLRAKLVHPREYMRLSVQPGKGTLTWSYGCMNLIIVRELHRILE